MFEELIDAFLVAAFIKDFEHFLVMFEERIKRVSGCDSIQTVAMWNNGTDGQVGLTLKLLIRRFNSWRLVETFRLYYPVSPCFTDLDNGLADLLDKVTKTARRNRFKVDGAD